MIEIDGSMGEGGGQVLRSALSLSCLTGKGFRIGNIRKSRSKPGLMNQHLMAVHSAARIASAELSGDRLGSQQLAFVPRGVQSGNYSFDIGTAGSTTLVLQTVMPPLLAASVRSQVIVTGGTHVPFSPSWNYFAEVFLPALARLGVRAEAAVDSCGFYPRGGGRVRCRLEPVRALSPLWAMERGRLLRVSGCSAVGNLPRSIAERQLASALSLLQGELGRDLAVQVDIRELQVYGQGTFIFLAGEYEQGRAGFTALGARGKPAEQVGEEAAREFLEHHHSGLPIDPHLADQLVLYLARAQGRSTFATSRITRHLETNLQVAGLFLELQTHITGEEGEPGTVTISPARAPG
ncbi:MAG TPA: RNA 3'-phosphate cyclase [Geobacter sp.]|nr:RNA 3'-phosphate cyclase [Geobacter sp.]